jgi:hypothetical protein
MTQKKEKKVVIQFLYYIDIPRAASCRGRRPPLTHMSKEVVVGSKQIDVCTEKLIYEM